MGWMGIDIVLYHIGHYPVIKPQPARDLPVLYGRGSESSLTRGPQQPTALIVDVGEFAPAFQFTVTCN